MKRLFTANDPAGARAEREARLAAGLSDPHVVAVYDLLGDGDDQWLVMEYVDGPTLAGAVASRGPLSPDDAAATFTSVAAALDAAHAAGIVHRDVKPSNILMASDGGVKLTDFGVARGAEPEATLTRSGIVTGSPAYLAPEVAAGAPATPASDVWSLGASLFHAVAGRPPYDVADGNVLGTLYRIVHEDPPRTDRAGWLAPLLAGTMTHDVAQRWELSRVRSFLAADPGATAAGLPPVAPPPAAAYDPSPTAVLSQPLPAAPSAAPPSSAPPRAPRAAGRRSQRGLLALLAVAAVALVAVVVGILATRGNHQPTAAITGPTGHPTPSKTPSQSPSSSSTQQAAGPSEAGVRSFVQSYLETAASDPRQAFEMLTPSFQRESHGWYGYDGWWGQVTSIKSIDDIRPVLDPLGVSYLYTYTRRGEGVQKDQPVTLQLVYQDGRYLISGDDTVSGSQGDQGDQGD